MSDVQDSSSSGAEDEDEDEDEDEGHKGKEGSINERTTRYFQAWNQGMVRTAALDQVLDKLNSGSNLLIINGNSGEGKTRVDEDVVCSACRSGNLKLVKMLFKNNASLSTNSTLNACLSAASEGGDTDIMKFLVDKGASVNAYGYFPLHAASSKNKTQAIKWLLQQGADIDRTDSRGNTALHAATCARFASEECVEVLLKAFAKVDTTNEDGNTALHCAVNPLYCHPNKSVCQKLIKKGVSVNMQNRGGETPLHLLCLSYNSSENGDSNVYRELAQIIIDRGASIDIKDELDEPALHGELKQLLKGSESAQEGENVCQICLCLVLFILFFHFAGIYVLIQADGDLLSVTSRLV